MSAQVVVERSFAGGAADGAGPGGSLIQVGQSFYGLTSSGGNADAGVLFSLRTDGTGYGVIRSFAGAPTDGSAPFGTPTQYLSALYGTTSGGGGSDSGTIFRFGLDGSGYGLVSQFAGSPNDGAAPNGSLVASGQTFYGTTSGGGGSGGGSIFKVNADGTGKTVLHSFTGGAADGQNPQNGALALVGSTLFGTTVNGGFSNRGIVYKIGTDGNGFTILHSFNFGASDGAGPSAR